MPRYIDADALIARMRKDPLFSLVERYGVTGVIEAEPTAPVREVRKGKWIRHSIGHENTPWGFDCSVCGKWFVIGEDTAERYHYCPNCGAEMETEDG